MELVDMQDLGSCASACGFESLHPHFSKVIPLSNAPGEIFFIFPAHFYLFVRLSLQKGGAGLISMEIEEYYDKIYRYCYYKVGNKQLAEDLTQETFLRYLKSTCTEPDRYLYTIAKHLIIDEYRKAKPMNLEDLESEPVTDGFEEAVIDKDTVNKALNSLSEEDRELVVLRFINEEPLSEISKITGISRFALYRRLNNAKLQLAKLLEG